MLDHEGPVPLEGLPDDGSPEEGLDLDGCRVAQGGHGDATTAQKVLCNLVVLVADGAVQRRELVRTPGKLARVPCKRLSHIVDKRITRVEDEADSI